MRIFMSFQYLPAMQQNVLQQAWNIKKATAYAAKRRPIQLTVQYLYTHKQSWSIDALLEFLIQRCGNLSP